ncbi:MAG: methyltransferase family protein [Acidiferrobacterales bacterium]
MNTDMALREEIQDTGNWLFRWRSYLPLAAIPILIIGLRDFAYPGGNHALDQVWESIYLLISFFGLAIRCYTVAHTPKGTSGRNTRKHVARELNTTGIYSIVRHPLYLGNFFIWLGISLFPRLWWVSAIYMLIFWLYYERIMFAEEEFLRKTFRTEFIDWASKTPAFLPRFRNWKPSRLPFSLKNVLKREYSGFFAIIVSFTILEVLGDVFAQGRPILDLMWVIIFSAGLVVYLALRALKKKSGFLSVEGR